MYKYGIAVFLDRAYYGAPEDAKFLYDRDDTGDVEMWWIKNSRELYAELAALKKMGRRLIKMQGE